MAENFTIEANDEVENFEVEFGEITRVSNNDFNRLENRPSYAGEVMTGETSIPEVPSAVSELVNDANYQTGAQVATAVEAETTARENADTALDNRLTTVEGIAGTALQPESINKVVMTDIAVGGNTSTATFNLEAAKENLLTGSTSSKQVSMPVASSTEAGIMNSSTFDAVSNNTNNINALLNGAVAITGLPAEPTQAQLTAAWETATGATALMNRAGIYDVTNGKVWTYYVNDTTWHSTTNTTQVTINTFTNNSEGTIKGSANVGQIFAETDGTGSVNGWDALNDAVSNNTSDIADLETAVDGKQDKLIAGANINIASDGKTISATDTTYTAGSGINISAQNVISANIDPADFFTASETVDGTGTDITLNNTIQAKLKSVQMDGNTTQQTYSGKNLLRNNYGSAQTVSGITFTKNADGTIIANGTATEGLNFYPGGSAYYPIPAGTYTLSDGLPNPTSTTYFLYVDAPTPEQFMYFNTAEGTVTRTLPEGTTIRPRIVIREGQTLDNVVFKPMLEQGSTATSFEPYVGGIPAPNPDYPQDVQTVTGEQTVMVTGENMARIADFDVSGTNYTLKSMSGNITATQTSGNNYFDLIAGTRAATWVPTNAATVPDYGLTPSYGGDYTLSVQNLTGSITGSQNVQVVAFTNLRRLSATTISPNMIVTNQTYTLAEGEYIKAIGYWMGASNTSVNISFNVQLEKGDKTNYQQYQGATYTVDLGSIELCKIGDYQDKIFNNDPNEDWYDPNLEDNAWYVHKETARIDVSSLDGWFVSGSYAYKTRNGMSDILPASSDSATAVGLCNAFSASTTNLVYAGSVDYGFALPGAGGTGILIRNKNVASLADFTTYLSNNSVYGYFALATATDTKITDSTLISELDALADALGYKGKTIITVSATGTNLPAILEVSAYQNSLAGVLGVIGRAEAA